jgi:hypothetical protein
MKKFLFFLILLLIAAWFIALGSYPPTGTAAGASTQMMTLFIPGVNIPLSYGLLVAFLLGVVTTLPFTLFKGKKNRKAAPNFAGVVPEVATTPEAPSKAEDAP